MVVNGAVRMSSDWQERISMVGHDKVRLANVWQERKNIMKQEYKFITPGLWGDLTADKAMAELERIREKRGELKPEYVVEESKDEKAVLHGCFQWDDTIAAQMWRKEQARQLIKNITVTIVNENVSATVRAVVNVATTNGDGRSYVPLTQAILDDVSYDDLLAQAKAEMESFIAKYSQLTELNSVKKSMMAVLSGIDEEESNRAMEKRRNKKLV